MVFLTSTTFGIDRLFLKTRVTDIKYGCINDSKKLD